MPKNAKSQKNSSRKEKEKVNEELILTKNIEGTIYGHVTRILGDCNFNVSCFDGKERMCHIRNSLKRTRSQRIELDSIVLVGLRDFQDGKGDIIHLYSKEHVAQLKAMKEIPSKIQSVTGIDAILNSEDEEEKNDDTGFDFNQI